MDVYIYMIYTFTNIDYEEAMSQIGVWLWKKLEQGLHYWLDVIRNILAVVRIKLLQIWSYNAINL